MKAIRYHRYGSPDFLQLEDVPMPSPKDNEVLIKTHASCINSWDWDLLSGKPFLVRLIDGGIFKPKGKILGCDVAGEIIALGDKVTKWEIGDHVYGDLSGQDWGGFAEYVCAPEDMLARKSPQMTFEQAAATPQAGVLALQGLRDIGQLQAGQHVLINGAAGGVGTFGIQLAKHYGADVTGVDRTEKLDLMRSLGADHVIDYQETDFTKTGQRYDLILDNVVHHSLSAFKRALNPNGKLVMVGGNLPLVFRNLLFGKFDSKYDIKILPHEPCAADLEVLNGLFEEKKVHPVIDRMYPLANAPEAMAYFEKGGVLGKVVIRIT